VAKVAPATWHFFIAIRNCRGVIFAEPASRHRDDHFDVLPYESSLLEFLYAEPPKIRASSREIR